MSRIELCRREATRYAIESADIRAAWHGKRMPRDMRDRARRGRRIAPG